MNIEQIMKPYLDKKEELEKKYIQDKNSLKLRLERLKENKASEIEEYVNNALNSNQNFYVGYGAMLKKDLEQAYAEKEAQLEKEINNFDKFYRVDVREIADIKQELRKDLFSAKKELEIRLQEVELNYNVVMLNLTKFKLEYDEQHRVLNGDAYKAIYAQADSLIDVKRNIQKELESVNKYIAETELTKEEISVLMMSMTPWEREEYDRRKSLKSVEPELKPVEVETIPELEEEEIAETIEELTKANDEIVTDEPPLEVEETKIDDEVPTEEETIVEDETIIEIPEDEDVVEEPVKENDELADALDDLLSEIFKDIIKSNKKLGVINTSNVEKTDDTIELDNGFYCNAEELTKATKKYYKKNKGNKFKVKGIEEDLSITRKGLKRLRKAIKKCSTLILLKDKKLGSFDIKRVYGKDVADEYEAELKEIGTIETEHKEGSYINASEYKESLKELFGVKRDSWLQRLKSKLTRSKEQEEVEENIDEQIYLDENVKTR